MKISLKRINTQERVTMEALLDSGVMELVMSSEFARKQKFKLKKIERLIYVRNVDGFFNKNLLTIWWRSIFITRNIEKE